MRLFKFLALFSLSILLGACGGGGSSGTIVTPVPGGSVTTTLSIDKTSLDPATSETTKVTAVFTDNGKPLAGMPVTFSATPGYATFNPADGKVYTDDTGKASIVLQIATNPPADGVAQLTVSAVVNGANVTQTTPFYVNKTSLKLATPAPYSSRLTAGSSTTISVQIVDSNGVPYPTPSGVDVYFSAERGSFIADNMVGKVRSNSAGVALVTYVPPYSTSTQVTDTITATLGSAVTRTTVTIDPRQAANIQYASAVPAKTTFGFNQPITVSYRVTDSQGTALPNVPVTFSISGTSAGATIIPSAVSDAYGYVSTTLTTGSSQTMLWITAKLADGTTAQSAVFSVTASGMSLSITPVTPAAPTTMASNANLPVSFKVVDSAGAAVAGQGVTLSVIDSLGNTSSAATLQQTSVVSDAQGNIATTLVSKTTAANLWVKATLQSSTTVFATSGMITVQSSDEGTVTFALSSSTPKGGDTIMATVKFTSLSPPPYAAKTVTIVSDNAAVIAGTTGTTDSQGNANIILTVGNITGRANLYAMVGNSLSPMTTVTSTSSTTTGGSLALAVAPATPKPGDSITATVTYTNAGATSLAGQTITIRSNNAAITDNTYTGTTDNTGKANIVLPVSATATKDTVITLYATSGSAVSPTAIVTVGSAVQDAATLTLTMGATATWAPPNTGVVIQGNKATFVTSQGVPIVNQPITFTVDRVDGWTAATDPHVTLNGTAFSNAAKPTTATPVTLNTDTSGTVLLPTIIEGTRAGNYVVYWVATTPKTGSLIPYTAYASTLVTITAATPMSFSPSPTAFATTDGAGVQKQVTIAGGVPNYALPVSSVPGDIAVDAIAGNIITLRHVGAAGAVQKFATITVTDSTGTSASFTVTYY